MLAVAALAKLDFLHNQSLHFLLLKLGRIMLLFFFLMIKRRERNEVSVNVFASL